MEKQLRCAIPPEESNNFCHRMVLHGRMHAQNFYATRLAFVSVTAQEEPFGLKLLS